jgi:hypothetical protein
MLIEFHLISGGTIQSTSHSVNHQFSTFIDQTVLLPVIIDIRVPQVLQAWIDCTLPCSKIPPGEAPSVFDLDYIQLWFTSPIAFRL